jgi:DNA polymerase-3 subunit delta'
MAPPGLGVGHFAVSLAAGLLCHDPGAAGEPCGVCPSCKWVEDEQHPDFRWVRPAADQEALGEGAEGAEGAKGTEGSDAEEGTGSGDIRIDQVRALGAFSQVSSHRGGHRVVVLGPVERLNGPAVNALLKGLEEPSEGLHLILYGERLQGVPATLLSRCRRVNLVASQALVAAQRLSAQSGLAWLMQLLEEPTVDPLRWAGRAGKADASEVLWALQLWLSDVIRMRLNLRPIHYPQSQAALARHVELSLGRGLAAISQGQFHLLQRSRQARHPLNATLFMESIFDDFRYAIDSRAESPAG